MPQNDDALPSPSGHTPNLPVPVNPQVPSDSHPGPAATSRRVPVWVIVICFSVVALGFAALWAMQSKEKVYVQGIACRNNLKCVGVAFRTWSLDQSDTFVFNVSTNLGGTLEWCLRDRDGLDKNSWIHFRALSNELANPKILCCPGDSPKPALDFQHLQASNVTYKIHSGTNIVKSNPTAVLIVCPIHHNVVLCDGSIEESAEARIRELLSAQRNANPSP